ncbi:conjugative transfer signal peptidase TraF [Vampirovibrio sp.]|uniref:conjugative transfer signal peptidase TraF n=1 Tax=Vampirovibrio sp. TaxID=2717857 RepID=UPI0035938036
MKSLLIRYFSGVALIGSLLWVFYAQGYRIITTPSVPPGIWKIEPIHGPIRRGQFVWLCPRDTPFFRMAKQRGYIPDGDCPGGSMHLMKPVAAVAGDVVSVTSQGVAVNGNWLLNSQSLPQDRRNFPLPQLVHKTYIVQTGSVWLVSTYHPESFDSRYFGPIHAGQIEAIAKPVFVLH